jgi:hypothetical protein
MTTTTAHAQASSKAATGKPRLLTRVQMLSQLEPEMQSKMRRGDEKTRNFLLDLMRLGRVGIFK